ncbi:MAG: ribosome-associated translation inhibitor RaiA [Spirochaetota bacterium]|nr:ribosome-associated translation inhibitor RaiA [Spirochaetota bacterium]
MNIEITGRHMEISNSLREYTEKKFKKIDKYFHHFADIHIIMYIEKFDHIVEAIINGNGGKFYAVEKANDMYSSIDKLIHKVEKQLVRYKEKHFDHKAISVDKIGPEEEAIEY